MNPSYRPEFGLPSFPGSGRHLFRSLLILVFLVGCSQDLEHRVSLLESWSREHQAQSSVRFDSMQKRLDDCGCDLTGKLDDFERRQRLQRYDFPGSSLGRRAVMQGTWGSGGRGIR